MFKTFVFYFPDTPRTYTYATNEVRLYVVKICRYP